MAEEQGEFLRYENARRVQAALFDRDGTTTGYSQRLNGSSNEIYGLAKSLTVMPGDIVNVEVYAKYIDPNTANWNTALTNLIAAIANNTGGIVSTGENYDASTGSFPYANMSGATGTEGSAPKAYLNWLIFDQDFNLLDAGFDRISESARETGTDAPHDRLHNAAPITIDQPGYVYIYFSNENGSLVEVFFDDFSVEHIHGEVVQVDDYYPFGLTFNSYSRENSTPQNFKFNDKEEQKDLGLGWYDYGWRQYDPGIGRWMVVDPWATKYKSWSPYNYGFNNPIRYADFMGLGPEDKKGPNGMSETQVYSRDDVGKDKTVTTVTQETRTKTTTENKDGTTTTTMTRSTTTNTVTKDNETGETSVQYGKTKTATYSETTNSEGKVVNSSNSATESKTTSQKDESMKNLNAWTNKISGFNASHDKTFNQTIASFGRKAMAAAALSTTFTLPISGTVGFLNAGGGMIITLSDQALTGSMLFIGTAPAIGAAALTDVTTSGGVYSHSTSQTKIKDGAAIPLIRHNVLDR